MAVSTKSIDVLNILKVFAELGLATLTQQSASVSEWCLTHTGEKTAQQVIEIESPGNPFSPVVDRSLFEMTIVDLLHKLSSLGSKERCGRH